MSHTKKEGPAGNRTTLRVTDATSTPSVTTAADEKPVAYIQEVFTLPRGTRAVEVRCPYCGRTHTHGWPISDGDRDPGHRGAHCAAGLGKGGYIIKRRPAGGVR